MEADNLEADLHGIGCPPNDKDSDQFHGAPECFQPVAFAMSCRIDFSEETQEEPDGRSSTAKKVNCGGTHSMRCLQRTGGSVLSPSPVLARVDALPKGSEMAWSGQQLGCDKGKKTASTCLSGGEPNFSTSSCSGDEGPSADEVGAAGNISSQLSASDGDSEVETSSDAMEAESSETSGSDSD
ncbi:hypothetical protein ACSSS7_006368 [Eimeria intestinalis]